MLDQGTFRGGGQEDINISYNSDGSFIPILHSNPGDYI